MDNNTQHVFKVTLIVKGDTRDIAYNQLAIRLNEWFLEPPVRGHYPEGTLLLWSTPDGNGGNE